MIRPWLPRLHAAQVLLLLVAASLCDGWRRDRPALLVSDGNLLLRGARDRNITLQTIGTSALYVNDVDLVHIATSAKNAAQLVDRWKQGIMAEVESSLVRLTDAVEGPSGMQSRLNALEMGTIGVSNASATGRPAPRPRPGMTSNGVDNVARAQFRRLAVQVRTLRTQVNGLLLKIRKDDCASNPCQNGGECEDRIDAFKCHCTAGWQGAQCNVDVNECANFAGTDLGCQNGATCHNLPGSYQCTCKTGWFGIHCMARAASCENQNGNELCGHGICVTNTASTLGYSCICEQGWDHEASSPACTKDVDECAGNHPVCSSSPLVPCINVPGSYHCGACPAGYTGNGYHCDDIDECAFNNGGCSISPAVSCINTRGSRVCGSCPPGYQGDGVTCSHAGFCGINNGGCHPLATCSENPTASSSRVFCRCPTGYVGNGMGPHGCQVGSGTEIEPIPTACASNPCGAHGRCVSTSPRDYTCVCVSGFTGRNCDTLVDPCSPNPCANGGSCRASRIRQAICSCAPGFSGPLCKTRSESCGGVRREPSGTLRFPSMTETYQHGLSCAWILTTNHSSVLNVTFTSFNLENSTDCQYDFLQIHDGRGAGEQKIGRYCGNALPNGGSIVSTHNSLYLWFHSDNSIAHEGMTLQWNTTTPVCGGEIQADYGTLSSPGSPGKYPVNRDCIWYINVTPGKRIQFHFFTMMLEEHPTCDHDYLKIKDGDEENSNVIGVYCNHTHPAPLVTPGPNAVVHFHSDAAGQDQGFQLSFSTVEGSPGCGGVFTATSGEVTSPSHPSTYDRDLDCEWRIQQPVGERVQLTWISFDLETTFSCWADYVEVFDGAHTDAPLLGRYCGQTLPPNSLSTSNVVLVRFKSDFSISGTGFRLKFELFCGGQYGEETGAVHSPFYPNKYPAYRTCTYEIAVPAGKAVSLVIQDMDIEKTYYSQCGFDYLEIRDGYNENATLIGKYCGSVSDVPDTPIESTHNYMFLKFQTDGSFQMRGFYVNYTTIDRGCGGLLRDPVGTIKPPNQGDRYTHNADCTWLIQAPSGFAVRLTWMSFSLEYSSTCGNDYVAISENITATVEVDLGKFCGTNIPAMMMSQGSTLNVKFHSDWSISGEGFEASYRFVDVRQQCGGHFHSPSGSLTSPNYPEPYPTSKECEWVIQASNRHQVTLNVVKFDIEDHTNCRFDYLEIRNGGSATSPLLGKYCGTTIPQEITSFGNQIYLKFVSDYSRNGDGFKIDWDSTTIGCGGTLKNSRGSISSPNYPQKYDHNAECTWNIMVSAGSVIEFIILDIDLEESMHCWHDYIEFYNAADRRGTSVGKYCGENHPTQINIGGNKASLRFRSDWSINGNGFLVNYKSLCQGLPPLRGHRGVIESPNFPNIYANMVNCSWTIEAPLGNKLNITFSHFDLEAALGGDCRYDYLEISEGEDVPTKNLTKLCGTGKLPAKIVSTERRVFVHFYSDILFAGSGFRLEWVVNGCGGKLTKPSGYLSSPGYPHGYPSGIECEWLIEVEYMNSIEITFVDISLEKTQDCSFDSLVAYGGADDTAPKLFELCHASNTSVFTSGGNKLFVRFKSDSSFSSRGFSAHYSSVDLQCGGRFTTPTGAIHSPNYPQNYPSHQNCEWLIEVPGNHLVNLTFVDFDVEDTTNCRDDYVKIYDGPSREDPLLGSHCGNGLPPSYVTTSNKVLVVMRSDSFYSAKGFRATYDMACGARIVTNDQGIISMHSAVGLHTDNGNCTWTIIAQNPADHITLTLTDLSLSPSFYSEECESEYIQVLEGEGLNGTRRAMLCNMKVPAPITSEGNALTINAVTLYTPVYHAQFTALYSVLNTACGGNYTSMRGTIASPGYPDNYPENAECVWVIHTSPGNPLTLEFESFAMEDSDNCNLDYLEIREGDGAGKLIDVFCGSNATNVESPTDLWIKFTSMGDVTDKGFVATYAVVHDVQLSGASGQIASPTYPKPLMQTGSYTWRITVDFASAIQITFDDFHIDRFIDYCIGSLDIFDGYDSEAPALLSTCGLTLPEVVQSSSNVIFVKLETSSFRDGTWFRLSWLQIPRRSPNEDPDSGSESTKCDEIIPLIAHNDSTRAFNSPGWPDGYGHNLDCTWTFESNPGTHLVLQFSSFNLEESHDCIADQVTVYTGGDSVTSEREWTQVGEYCLANTTAVTITATNLMKVNFHSDVWVNGTGFKATVTRVCGGQLDGPNGVIEAGEGAREYQTYSWRVSCEWTVVVRPGRTIAVEFESMDIHATDNGVCSENYVILKNGGEASSPLLGAGKYCGNTVPSELTTTGNRLYVKAYGSRIAVNFKLSYREVSVNCGREIFLSKQERQQNISSPNYPSIPTPHSECFWTIVAPAGEEISLHFIDRFDLTSGRSCKQEYVEVRDGGTESSNLLGRYCGTMAPSTLKTTGNVMYVHFFTDIHDPKNGFRATAEIATCGGIVRGRIGTLKSPNYPAMYPSQVRCDWWIVGPEGHTLKIQFRDLHLPGLRACNNTDHVNVSNAMSFGQPGDLIGQYCGSSIPDAIETTGNIAKISFGTDARRFSDYRGFSLNYTASYEVCRNELSGNTGEFTSINYPNGRTRSRYCTWRISVPEGFSVKVEFLDLDLEEGFTLGRKDRIMLFNDFHFASLITSVTAAQLKTVVSSTGNKMIVSHRSVPGQHRGFKARYSATSPSPCEGPVTGIEGSVLSAQNNLSNYKTFHCEWKLSSPFPDVVDQTLVLTISTMFANVTAGKDLSNLDYVDNIIVRDEKQGIALVSLLNNSTKTIVASASRVNTIIARKMQSTIYTKFTIDYKWQRCGGTLTGPSHNVTSPTITASSTNPVHCAWRVNFPDIGETIKVSFKKLNVGPCDKNYLTIRNGGPQSPELARYCNVASTLPEDVRSQSNKLWIEYHTEDTTSQFEFTLETVSGGCGGVMHQSTGVIASPAYPQRYPNNAECSWQIIVQQGYFISLSFFDRFSLETSTDCAKDFVQIFDWKETVLSNGNTQSEFVELGKVCGRDPPRPFNSTTYRMKILFRSDNDIPGDGFRARWNVNCGGLLEATRQPQYLQSPGYPRAYDGSLSCNYEISAPDKNIIVEFMDFRLETGFSDCRFDNLTIIYNNGDNSQTWCGANKPPLQRVSSKLNINFTTDRYVQERGFELKYYVDECGGNVTQPTTISSPSMDGVYYGRLNCTWSVKAPAGKSVVVRFERIDLEMSGRCWFDYVAVYDGPFINQTRRLASICGHLNTTFPSVPSTADTMTINFVTDSTGHYGGFSAKIFFTNDIASGCGGPINLTRSQEFKTQKTETYDSLQECHWLVSAPADNAIRLRINSMDLRNSTYNNSTNRATCSGDYLEIFDGASPMADLIGRYCGNLPPTEIVSSTTNMWIRFVSDGTINGRGVTAVLEPLPSPCGNSSLQVTNVTQTLRSPGFPGAFPAGLRCRWNLGHADGFRWRRFHVHFKSFNLENSEKCSGEKLQIYDKRESNFVFEGFGEDFIYSGTRLRPVSMYTGFRFPKASYTYCGGAIPHDYYSTGDLVQILFVSSTQPHDTPLGFELEYNIAGCSRNYTAPQGRIVHEAVSDCWVTITAATNQTISLYFSEFSLFGQPECTRSALEVYDGGFDAPKLQTLCGTSTPSPIFSTGNKLSLHSWSVRSVMFENYDITYTTTDKGRGCGGRLYNYGGRFTSPMYPQAFRNESDCTWEISVPTGLKVVLSFIEFDIGTRATCATDYLTVSDVSGDGGFRRETVYCGGDNPAKFHSSGEQVTVQYQTSVNNGGQGWIIEFTAVASNAVRT